MCPRCALDLRATPLKVLAVLRDDRTCERFRNAVDREMAERMAALDIDDPLEEQL